MINTIDCGTNILLIAIYNYGIEVCKKYNMIVYLIRFINLANF